MKRITLPDLSGEHSKDGILTGLTNFCRSDHWIVFSGARAGLTEFSKLSEYLSDSA